MTPEELKRFDEASNHPYECKCAICKEWWERVGPEEDDGLCAVCGGDGVIMACDGDGSDWGEDTYSGPMDAVIECRHCKGTGVLS